MIKQLTKYLPKSTDSHISLKAETVGCSRSYSPEASCPRVWRLEITSHAIGASMIARTA